MELDPLCSRVTDELNVATAQTCRLEIAVGHIKRETNGMDGDGGTDRDRWMGWTETDRGTDRDGRMGWTEMDGGTDRDGWMGWTETDGWDGQRRTDGMDQDGRMRCTDRL